jgi:hypothetical protein
MWFAQERTEKLGIESYTGRGFAVSRVFLAIDAAYLIRANREIDQFNDWEFSNATQEPKDQCEV